jgi:hypothetical protein
MVFSCCEMFDPSLKVKELGRDAVRGARMLVDTGGEFEFLDGERQRMARGGIRKDLLLRASVYMPEGGWRTEPGMRRERVARSKEKRVETWLPIITDDGAKPKTYRRWH